MGKTVYFSEFDSDFEGNASFWTEHNLGLEQAKQRYRIKRMARKAAREKATADSDWQSAANHYLWEKRFIAGLG